jgi:glycerophosphoryl diester phosphodiesterase
VKLRGRTERRPLVIGHRGAPRLAPENTLASFEAAVGAGADLVEFDVGRELLIGHSEHERPVEEARLGEALALLGGLGAGMHVDLKCVGIEQAVVDEARRHGVEDRVVISTTWQSSLQTLATIAPVIPRALGYPPDRFGASKVSWPRFVTWPAAVAARAAMPTRIPSLLSAAHANVLSLHHAFVSDRVVKAAHARDAAIFVWTVNDPDAVARFAALGVDGIVTDDPGMALQTLATLPSE